MIIVATYRVDKEKYHAPETRHDISLTTMEYVYGNDMLVRLQIGANTGVRLSNMLSSLFVGGPALPGELYLFKNQCRQLKELSETDKISANN